MDLLQYLVVWKHSKNKYLMFLTMLHIPYLLLSILFPFVIIYHSMFCPIWH
jgi:hypothetical protein